MFSVLKDPDADLDYQIDWTEWLGNDTITESVWSVPGESGLITHDESVDSGSKITTVWLAGGTVSNTPYVVTNHRSLLVRVIQR